MRVGLFIAAVAGCVCLAGQDMESPEVMRARQHAERVRVLVSAGAAPQQEMEKAERLLADARDEDTLQHTLYAARSLEEATSEQVEEMVGAAARRLERCEADLARTRSAVERGVLPKNRLPALEVQLDERREALALAKQRAGLFVQLEEIVRAEQELARAMDAADAGVSDLAVVYPYGMFSTLQLGSIQRAFENQFGRPLPVSANGATAVHRALGFDHRGRVDVALHPDDDQGRWLRALLEERHIPYIAYRGRVQGKSTGAHIHIGLASPRLSPND